ncbi:TPA: hypothetical protein ACGUM0_002889 [Vibrio vulnificus]|uniref:hypothetical protein n=1 Tax=Vibrio vulnificus TaxID=672 RepID=UPI0010232157|nr:hypothetical protein [Vibrio vulnificus]EIV8467614.1 hypothetical protein [Vibrio vulnificus]MBN8089469.1 hypothetical protein [Vibrio vulnificus]MBN8118130.1 hypothetical protein [Vibrio vulnificus]RZP55709.1 hypothetical protein D8T45_22090 [Vibrio vulnificus]RZR20632.1 hypothetical protein D8T24_00550 [Vibrio vulnificus]
MNSKKGLVIIAILVSLKFVFLPWFDWVVSEVDAAKQKSQTISKLQYLNSKKDATESQLKLTSQTLGDFRSRFLADDEAKVTTTVFDYLKKQEKITDVKVTGLKLGDRQQLDIIYYPVRFNVSGDIIGMVSFLNALKDAPFKIVVAQSRILKKDSRVDTPSIVADMTVYILIKKEPTP